MRGLILVLCVVAAACTTSYQRMQMTIGQSVQEVSLKHGMPSNYIDMPNGDRAFQWTRSRSIDLGSTNSTQTGSAMFQGPVVTFQSQTVTTEARPIQFECTYTLITRWDPQQNAWIVREAIPPRAVCN